MNEVERMLRWVQGCLDSCTGKTVRLEVCDGVPGNWTLYYLGTRELCRSQDLQGAAMVRYRCHYQLRTIDSDACAAREMQTLLQQLQEAGQGPGFAGLPGNRLTVENLHRTKVNRDGTGEYSMDVYGEYDQYYSREA